MRWYRAPELVMESKDRVNQLDKVIDIIGTPPGRALNKKGKRERVNFQQRFPQADPKGIDLMNKFLVFLPRKRPFDCDYERDMKSLAEVKKAIYDETDVAKDANFA
eukprot:gene17045-48234_t